MNTSVFPRRATFPYFRRATTILSNVNLCLNVAAVVAIQLLQRKQWEENIAQYLAAGRRAFEALLPTTQWLALCVLW